MNTDRLGEIRQRLSATDTDLVAAGLAHRVRNPGTGPVLAETRHADRLECRENDDGTYHVTGYATTWDTPYDVAGGPPFGWVESIARGATTKSLAENDDVRFLVNHDGVPLARTPAGTMTLEQDDIGLRVDVPSLDARRNPTAAELVSALDRRDLDQMSFAFWVIREEWSNDWTERRILEVKLFDVSAVTEPANPATIIALRHAATTPQPASGMSVAYARAQADALTL